MIRFKQEYNASGDSYQLNEISNTFHQTRYIQNGIIDPGNAL
jgi:hypothetical protein